MGLAYSTAPPVEYPYLFHGFRSAKQLDGSQVNIALAAALGNLAPLLSWNALFLRTVAQVVFNKFYSYFQAKDGHLSKVISGNFHYLYSLLR